MQNYIYSVNHPFGKFVYICLADNLFEATKTVKAMAGEVAEIIEISESEAQELINKDGYKLFFA